MARDSQRSLVYAWEKKFWGRHTGREGTLWTEEMSLDECRELVNRLWRTERGRYGRAKQQPPEVTWTHGYGANATRWQIRLTRHSRNQWVVLHELAHSMAGGNEGHGPRFVGILVGMASRHIKGLDGQAAIDLAAEMGVRVHVRSVGCIPVVRDPTLADRILDHLPGRITQIAWRAGIRRTQVRGAALTLIRRGDARYFRGRLVALAA